MNPIQVPPDETRPWGSFWVLDEAPGYKVKRIEVWPGKRLSLQAHHRRQEQWTVVAGQAIVTLDEQEHTVTPGQSIFIPRQARHRVANPGTGPLVFIEVQTGEYLGEDDIVRFADDFDRR